MSDLPNENILEEACNNMPLFPLPRVVLLSGTLLRLHVFEPRYVQLVEDVLKENKIFAVPMIQSQDLTMVQPALHSVAGFGMIVHHEKLPDERYNIVLLGLGRILIQEEQEGDRLYRVARGALLAELEEFDTTSLMMLFAQVIVHNSELSGKFNAILKEDLNARTRVNVIAQLVLQDADERQAFLATESIADQVDILSERLAELLLKTNISE